MKILNFLIGLFVRELDMGQAVPRGFGVAWQTPFRRSTVVMPIGLNVAAAAFRRGLLWARYFGAQPLNQMPAYHAGLLAGRRDAVAEYVKAFAQLVDSTKRYHHAIDDLLQRSFEGDFLTLGAISREQFADLEHARMRASQAVIRARQRLSDMRANTSSKL